MPRSEYEDCLLGALLNDSELLNAGRVSAELFQGKDAREVLNTMLGLHNAGRPVNRETLLAEVGDRVPLLYLSALSEMASGANAAFYLEHLVEEARRRELRSTSLWLQEAIEKGAAPEEVQEALEERLARMRRTVVDTYDVDVHAMLHQLVSTVERRIKDKVSGPSGIPTGLRELDRSFGGLQPGRMYLIAARTSRGKTSLAMTMADYQVRQGIPVGYCSLEMSGLEVVERLVSMRSGVPVSRMKNGTLLDRDMGRILEAAGTFDGNLRILDKPDLTPRGLRAWAHGAVGKGDQVLYVDYLGLLDISEDERARWEVMGQVSRMIKGLARELRTPIVSLLQLNRTATSDIEPELHMLRDSGAFEQDSDVVLLLHLPDPKETDGATVHANLRIAKNRNGPTGRVELMFNRSITRFSDWQEEL